ncbi:MAG: hypothetical protein AB1499_00945 [Nitrospirota bacterium]
MKLVFLKLSLLFLISIMPAAFYNYLFDPFGIFNDTSLTLGYEPGYEPNQHYAKMRHLINDNQPWDSYLFGSSRVGKIDPGLISGGTYYNMNYSEGVPREHLADIKILLEKGLPVKNVMIGIDNSSYSINPKDHDSQIMRHGYDASFLKRILFQIKYLCSAPRFGIMKYIRQTMDDSIIVFDILGNGMQRLERVDDNIERNIDDHVSSPRFQSLGRVPFDEISEEYHMQLMEDTLRDISEIARLSREKGFNLYVFINPIHKLYYMQHNPELFLVFKEKLAGIVDYWDFSGFNSVTTNNYYYYETSHYRRLTGSMITCRITDCTRVTVPPDFGVFITAENVSWYIAKQKKELRSYEKVAGHNVQ